MWFVCQSIHQLFEILKSTSTGGFNLLRVPEYWSFQKVCFSILIRNTATLGELFLDNLPGSLLFSMNEIILLQYLSWWTNNTCISSFAMHSLYLSVILKYFHKHLICIQICLWNIVSLIKVNYVKDPFLEMSKNIFSIVYILKVFILFLGNKSLNIYLFENPILNWNCEYIIYKQLRVFLFFFLKFCVNHFVLQFYARSTALSLHDSEHCIYTY